MDKGSPGMESLQRLESLEKDQSGPWFLCFCVPSVLIFFLLWQNMHNIKRTTLTVFKCTIQGHCRHSDVVQPASLSSSELSHLPKLNPN